MTEIKSIIFDLGGVILNLDYSKTVDEFKKIGVLHFKELYSQKKQTLLFDDFEKGEIKPEEFISSLKDSENLKIKEIDFINAWNAMLLEISIEKLQFIDGLKKLISDNKGDLVDTKLLGKRQLAYPINNMNYANYVHLDVNVEPETLDLLEEKFRYDQNVFRHLTVKLAS